MSYIDKMDIVAKQMAKEFKDVEQESYKIDQIEVDMDFLDENRLIKVKNNLEIYKDEMSKLFLENAFITVKKGNQNVGSIFFSYEKQENGIIFISRNPITNQVNGGTFKITEDGKLDIFGAMTKSEAKIYSNLLKEIGENVEESDETQAKNIANNLICDYAATVFYIDFLSKYKKEFISVSNRAVEKPNNPKKKTKGRKQKKISLIKKIVVNSNAIKQYENKHQENIYERHMESWTVSGHFRKYSNGKKTWIAPYVKGDPNKVKGKTYVIK